MTKVNKKSKVQELKHSALACVLRECEKHVDELTIEGEIDFMHNGKHIGEISFKVYECMGVPASTGTYDTPPSYGSSDFVLENASVHINSSEGEYMKELSESVNAAIALENDNNLNY